MSDLRRFRLAHGVIEQPQKLGLFGNVEKRLLRMARHSAPFTHQAGNRRFESWVPCIEQGVVVSIKKLDPDRARGACFAAPMAGCRSSPECSGSDPAR